MKFTINHVLTIITIIFLILIIYNISAGNSRNYVWQGANPRFANRLENCKRYTTPVVYRAPIIIPVEKYQTKILGMKDGMCVIREYYADPFAPFIHYDEFHLDPEMTKELSNILKTAFKEPNEREVKASELALQFKKKYKMYAGYYNGKFYGNQKDIKECLRRNAKRDPEYIKELNDYKHNIENREQ